MRMPVAPLKITCQSCGWSRVIPQQGDVLFIPKQCEHCGSEKLTQSTAGQSTAGMLERLNPFSFIQAMLRK
jgi:Zn finger protein HypA/HybF involved in hydrogenase expression